MIGTGIQSAVDMARFYIKDLIKSMLKMDSNSDFHAPSAVSLCSRASTDDETEADALSQHALGIHSPNGGPLRGRSIKEIDELMTNLRKENFNLKLRIYFLEERMGTNFNLDKENAIKKNIELKVEVESLKKELVEKQDLLCQAVKAMELDEEEHKKESVEKDRKINHLQSELDGLQQKYDLFQDEMRCQGDHGMEEAYSRKADSNIEMHIRDLENKIVELETQLAKEKSNNRELENLLQLTESRVVNVCTLETELKRKDEAYKTLRVELDQRNEIVSKFNSRITALEQDIIERQREVDYMKKDLETKTNQVLELQGEVEEYHKIATETKALYDSEKRKCERHKTSIMHRNQKIVDLESQVEKSKAKVYELQARLEAAHNEVKIRSKTPDADLSPKKKPSQSSLSSQLKKTSASPEKLLTTTQTSTASTTPVQSSPSDLYLTPESPETSNKNLDQLQRDLGKSKKHIAKLEQDQLRACKIIQSLLDKHKKNENKVKELQGVLAKKESQIEKLEDTISKHAAVSFGSSLGECVVPNLNLQEAAPVRMTPRSNNVTSTITSPGDNENSMAEANEEPKFMLEQYKELTDKLEEQKQVLVCTLEETKYQMHDLETKHKALQDELKVRENRIIDLEFELLSIVQGVNNDSAVMGEKSDVGNEKPSNFFIREIEEKDREIERLENELRKRTCDLQGIVNKELWEKNREIEKMQKRYGDIITGKDNEITKLEQNLIGKNEQLQLLKEKISELGLDVNSDAISFKESVKDMEEKLKAAVKERDYFKKQLDELNKKNRNSSELELLQKEHRHLQEELEKCEKLRSETNEVCSILSTRLEELAYFLDSLLKQKSILGYLGHKQNDKVRQLINQSLDISRTLALSLNMDPDQSLLQLSNITSLLNNSRFDSVHCDDSFNKNEEEQNKKTILSVIPADVSLTYQSHLYQVSDDKKSDEQSRIITVLRGQIENLKKEIEIRDTELNRLTVSRISPNVSKLLQEEHNQISLLSAQRALTTTLNIDQYFKNDEEFADVVMQLESDQQSKFEDSQRRSRSGDRSVNTSTTIKLRQENLSESESWSEPDRSVSKARMGLEESLKPRKSKVLETSTVSTEGENEKSLSKSSSRKSILAENRQTIIALHEQICDLENLIKTKDEETRNVQDLLEQTQKLLDEERQKVEEATEYRNVLLDKINRAEQNLEMAEATKLDAELQLEELQKTVAEVKTSQKLLQETMEIKNKETQNKINLLEAEKVNILEALGRAEQAAEDARIDVAAYERKLQLMKDEMERMEVSVRQETQHEWEEKLRGREQEFEEAVRAVEQNAEEHIRELMKSAQELRKKYEEECVKRDEVDKLMGTIKELEKVKKVVKVTEERIHTLEEREEKLLQQLQESEVEYLNKENLLRQDLEKINLMYSESLLEKSLIMNEKSELDRQLRDLSAKEVDFVKQVREYKDDFASMKENFQKQVAHLELQKSKLEVRIGELEQHNAELKNKLIKMQSGDQISLSRSAPNSSSRILDMFLNKTCPAIVYKRQCSDNSGYTSEDAANELNIAAQKQFSPAMDLVPIDAERQHSNSSPDLGIESDHGRFSSLETSVNLSRPFLKTLELTESMSNLLSKDEMQTLSCNNEQCCMKTKEIVNENNDLKKRLLRTRRALEETVSQLTIANQRKKQVEKTICKQIHKTSQVLRKAKANLDSGSENDVINKT